MKFRVMLSLLTAVVLVAPCGLNAAPFTAGNLVVYRAGDGITALSNSASPLFLEERTTTGALVQSIALPVAASGGNFACTAAGMPTTEGFLSRSADGNYIVGGCYDAAVGAATPHNSPPTTVRRVVFRVDASGNVDTSTALNTTTLTGNIRTAASSNGTDLWMGTSTGGFHYATLGASSATQISTTAVNVRTVQIESGQLYGGSGAGAFRLFTIGTGLPTTSGNTMVSLPGYPTTSVLGNAFFFADLDVGVAGVDTVYQADDQGTPGGIRKYSLVAGSWTANGVIDTGVAAANRGLTGSVSGGVVTLFSSRNGTSLATVIDTAGYNAAPSNLTVTSIATPTSLTVFRGVAFVPGVVASVTPFAVSNSAFTVQALNSLASTGTGTTLPTAFAFAETGGNTSYSADDGASSAGGVYSYGTGASSERALGTLRDGTVAPVIGTRLQNSTGDIIKFLYVQFAGEQWRRDSAGTIADRLDFQYSLDATSLTTGTWVDTDALDFISPIAAATTTALDGDAVANRITVLGHVEGLNLANGATMWVRWLDADAAGNDDGLAIDDVAFAVPSISIEAADALTEGNVAGCPVPNNLRFTVSRTSGVPSTGIPYTFTTTAVSAAQGVDYTGFTNQAQTLNFGGTISNIDVPIICDDSDETDETFTIAIATAAGSGYFVLPGANTGTATITDDDISTLPTISINDVSIAEGNSGTSLLTFAVTLSAPAPAGGVTFDIATSDGTATDADNDYEPRTLIGQTIAAGNSSYNFDVTINGDATFEASQSFVVNISNVTNVAPLGNDLTSVGTITNDDSAPTPFLVMSDAGSVAEGNSSASNNQMVFAVTLSAPANAGGATFTLTANANVAEEGEDYLAPDSSIIYTIPEGQTTLTPAYAITILGDLTLEADETVVVTPLPISGAVMGGSGIIGVGTITNDDTAPLTIEAIQGNGHASPVATQTVTTLGNIVTAVLPAPNGGFTIQMKDAQASGGMATSNGVLVFTGGTPILAVGDEVDVRGTVVEFHTSMTATAAQRTTEFTNAGLVFNVISSGNALPAPVGLDAMVPSPNPASPYCGAALGNFECIESMRVTTTTGMVNLGNQTFGTDPIAEMWVTTSGQRVFREGGLLPGRETEVVPTLTPAAPPLPTTFVYDLNPELFELDMDRAGLANTVLVPGTTFSATGVLSQEFGGFDLFPTQLTVNAAAAALPTPVDTASATQLTIGSQNLHLLFDDVNDPWNTDDCTAGDVDFCPTTLRWNAKLNLLSRQIREQLKSPMVVGVQEIEKLGALQALATKINTDLGVGSPFTYTAHVGAIDDLDGGHQNVGFLIRSNVSVVSLQQLNTTQQWTFNGAPQGEIMDRPPFLLRATVNIAAGGPFEFAVMVVHQRSLTGIDNLTPLADQINAHRVRQKRLYQAALTAQAIQQFRAANPGLPFYLVGDFNAFPQSDGYADVTGIIQGTTDPALSEYDLSYFGLEGSGPNGNIVTPPLTAASALAPAGERYSYQFQSMPQQIDHAMMSAAGLEHLEDMQFSRNNVDQQARFMISFSNTLGTETPLVSSDHDGFVLFINTLADALFGNGFEN
ncbi:MAG: Calx-beta domain-containing protein [Pseudomonadota bacterium]|nr:Calx-beta domain-containing protein [Pseudomonadota bacterium]